MPPLRKPRSVSILRDDAGLARRFFRAASKSVDVAWQLSRGADLALPQVAGEPPRVARLTNAYVERVLTAAERDPTLTGLFLSVTGLLDPPTALFRPKVIRWVWLGHS